MSWPPDYHMHTPLCRHAVGEPHAYAARAVAAGLTEIGFLGPFADASRRF